MSIWNTPIGRPLRKRRLAPPLRIPEEWPQTAPVEPVKTPEREPVLVP